MKSPTDTTTLEALLRRWAELEPERIRLAPKSLSPVGVLCFRLVFDRMDEDDIPVMIGAIGDEHLIQAATQEAIERRGWRFALDNVGYKDRYSACVYDTLAGMQFCCDGADTPAAALLSAYVQALEAQV